jgi:glycerol-3-phosphate acyltransferase PlsY
MTAPIRTHPYAIVVLGSYLLGSIPFGLILVRVFRGEDVRESGSGNIGATNVARTSPALGVATLILDAAKGLLAVILTRILFGGTNSKLIMTLAALGAVLGHMFPVWLKFRGGKGVATSLGAFVLLAPKSILCMVGVFLLVIAVLRYVSLGSVLAAALFPLLVLSLHEYSEPPQLVLVLVTSLLVLIKHRQNIARLLAGTESKLGASRG